MRIVVFHNLVSLDGYFAGANNEIDWHNIDTEYNDYAINFLDRIDTILFGRITYDLMASYWPTDAAIRDHPKVAGRMNSKLKIVFSRKLKTVDWQNTRLVNSDIAEYVDKLKKKDGGDIAIFGSSDLALPLIEAGLVDELNIIINPVLLGKGKTILNGLNVRIKLHLEYTRVFRSGNVLLSYKTFKA